MPFRPCVVIHSASFSHLKVYCTVCTLLEKWAIEFSIIYQFIVCDTYILYMYCIVLSVQLYITFLSVINNRNINFAKTPRGFLSVFVQQYLPCFWRTCFRLYAVQYVLYTVGWLDFCIDMRSGHVRVAQKYFSICLSSLALETFLHYVI